MIPRSAEAEILEGLNAQQRAAVIHGEQPLLIIAGAGTGKTRTLVHRVAWTIHRGIDPSRLLLLTFTRRAAAEMLRRVDGLLRRLATSDAPTANVRPAGGRLWGGTFHATASRLLRMYGDSIGLDPSFTIHDRSDSEDLLDVARTELGLAKADRRFPKKGTCMAIYSHCVNAQRPLEEVLADVYPWCKDYAGELKHLFRTYVDRKESGSILDYDDLLLFWRGLLADEKTGERVRQRFDCVMVDEYQDTNTLQSDILRLLRPDGKNLTVVGDDAQSVYSFRAATVRNILDFPQHFPGTTLVKLEHNYRSTPEILDATNKVIAQAKHRYEKELWSTREAGDRPSLVTCEDENEQAEYLVRRILEHREAGIDLRRQAVLFRASHHSMILEAELTRHNIPFVKYGGLKFMEAGHVKDLMAFLRLAENRRDLVSGTRVLMLLPGVGPKIARRLMDVLIESGLEGWEDAKPPVAATEHWPKLCELLREIGGPSKLDMPAQINRIRNFYSPLIPEHYDNPIPRQRDLEQLEQLAARYSDRATMLSEMALDPPSSTEDFAGPPLQDEDYLILSTIHSAKGLEWDVVYVIHASDGNIPSDMATGSEEEIEEELRLFYVALTRAKSWLYVCYPLRYYYGNRSGFSDPFGYAQLSRFIAPAVKAAFECGPAQQLRPDDQHRTSGPKSVQRNVRDQARAMWS